MVFCPLYRFSSLHLCTLHCPSQVRNINQKVRFPEEEGVECNQMGICPNIWSTLGTGWFASISGNHMMCGQLWTSLSPAFAHLHLLVPPSRASSVGGGGSLDRIASLGSCSSLYGQWDQTKADGWSFFSFFLKNSHHPALNCLLNKLI